MSFAKVLQDKLKAGEYKDATRFLRDEQNESQLHAESMDVVSCLVDNLTEENLRDDFKLFSTCEDLLKLVAGKCVPQEVLFELLERVELTKNDEIFTSLLKALQLVLLRLKENKARSLEWSLNSIFSYIDGIKLPDYMTNIGEDEEKLLESDETVRRILQLYMTVLLFLEPIVKEFEKGPREIFKSTGITRKNVVICFILQLMGKPLVYLNVHGAERTTDGQGVQAKSDVKTYTRQVAEDLVSALTNLLGDPFRLLQYGEKRIRWPHKRRRKTDGVFEEASIDIFMNDEKCPLLSLGMLYYLMLGEDILPAKSPKVYSKHYIYEMGLYHSTQLLNHEQTVVHHKGIVLASNLRRLLGTESLKSDDLDVDIHRKFCKSLSKVIVYSNIERNRKEGTFLFRNYIFQFDSEGRYLLISNLFKTIEHNGLRSYIATVYKDLVHIELNSNDAPSAWFIGNSLKHLLMKEICVLKKGIETDLVENADTVISGLNILRFLLIRDKTNNTSVWNYIGEIETQFLQPLRKSIDLARAHFKEEHSSVAQNRQVISKPDFDLDIGVLNGEQVPQLTKERKLELLAVAMNNFDLMDCLMARVLECVDTKPAVVDKQ